MSTGAYAGSLGGGKTLHLVRDASEWSLKAGGAPICANFTLFPGAFVQHHAMNPRFKLRRFRTGEDLVRFIAEGGGILAWDEMPQDIDARQSTNAKNILLSQTLMFLRKWGISTLYSVQDLSQIDKRMRAVTDTLTYCEGSGPKVNRSYKLTRTHYKTGHIIRVDRIAPEEARQVWTAYDTYEYVERFDFPSTLKTFDALMKRLEEGAKFARGYTGDSDRAWEAFVSQHPHPSSKAAKSSEGVSPSSHVRKGPGRAAVGGGRPGTGKRGPLAAEEGA